MKHILTALLALLLTNAATADTIIHREKSLYRNILVFEYDGQRCMNFTYDPVRFQEQSCFFINNPNQPVHFYSKAIMATGTCFHTNPKRILIIGLGGGVVARHLSQLLPEAIIDSVEIDPAVTRIAQEYFLYQPDDNRQRSYNADGRIFIKRALMKNMQWDWIILDAFNADYIPEHLMTQEFLEEVKSALKPDGIITANTLANSQLFHSENATYNQVFGTMQQLTDSVDSNRILFRKLGKPLSEQEALQIRTQCINTLDAIGIDANAILATQASTPAWPDDTRVLTDQYAPVNLLKD